MIRIEYSQMQKILEMISKNIYNIEFFFNLYNNHYSICKNKDYVIFRKYKKRNKIIEHIFNNFDELYETKLIDDILLCNDWKNIESWYCDYMNSEDENLSIADLINNLKEYMADEQERIGNIIYEFRPNKFQITKYMLKYVSIGPVIFLLLSIFPPLTGGSNWKIVFFVLGIDIFTLIVFLLFGLKKNFNMIYRITDKKIIKVMGVSIFETEYSNISKIKMKKSLLNKNKGTIKIFVYKGISINYHLVGLKDIQKIYDLIFFQLYGKESLIKSTRGHICD